MVVHIVMDSDQLSWKDVIEGMWMNREKAEDYRLTMEESLAIPHKDRFKIVPMDVDDVPDPEELWDKIQSLSQQVFWKEQQRVTDGIALGELKKVLQEYGVVK